MSPAWFDQALLLAILAAMLGLFLWGRWRHDVVALAALMACVLVGLVPAAGAFAGFGHPAVITVACVLVLSRGLQSSGAVDLLARNLLPEGGGRLGAMLALMALGAGLSAFMNNVGAMALLMPVAVQLAGRLGLAPGQVLMPLAFGTILGGMTTLVGTPPNLIVSGFREGAGLGAFGMFAFTPVGLAVAAAGVLFVAMIGWRLVPARKAGAGEGFATGAYLTEARIPEGSKAVGMTLRALEEELDEAGAQIVGLVRHELRLHAPQGGRRLHAGDILVLEADVEGLAEALAVHGIVLEESGPSTPREGNEGDEGDEAAAGRRDEDVVLRELVVLPGSRLVGYSARDLHLRSRYGINLLAVSREGQRPRARLRTLKLRPGDLMLMQGPSEVLGDFIAETGTVPLGERDLRLPDRRGAITAAAIMAGSVALATLGVLPAAAAFALGVLASMVLRTVPPRQVYGAIDWPVIVLLAALIPVAGAMETTGAAARIAVLLVDGVAMGLAPVALVVVLVTTMLLSDLMNNAATAAVMCPVALGVAAALGADPDGFLMAVAIGASCAFLTPIGHQNNTLILGPGGFRFADYWRLGLPLELLVVAVSVPLLLIIWPL
jgi:di/tricarboxylate transporter